MSYKVIAKYETFQQDLRCRVWEWSVYNRTEEVQCYSVQDLNWFPFQKWLKVYWSSVRRQLPRKCAEKCGWSREKHVRENSTLFQTGTQNVMYNMIHILLRKPLLNCFGKMWRSFSAVRNCTSEKLFSPFYYLSLGKTFKVHTNNTTGNSVGRLVLNNSQWTKCINNW